MRGAGAVLAAALAVAGCTTGDLGTQVETRAARSVVVNVLVNQYPRPAAEIAAGCVLQGATEAERAALARDVGNRAGTSTVATIRAAADRPAARACLAASGLAPVAVVP